MKLAQVIEGGLAGATTVSLLTNTLRKIDGSATQGSLFDGRNLQKRFKKARSKKAGKAAKQYIRLAGDVLESAAFLGLSSFGKRKHAMLRGAILGTVAGLATEFLHDANDEKDNHTDVLLDDELKSSAPKGDLWKKAARVGLYTAGGMVAGKVVQLTGKKKKKK